MHSICRRDFLAGVAVMCSGLAPQWSKAGAAPLVFGIITPRAAEQMKESWRPFVENLSEHIDLRVELRAYPEYADLVSAFRRGEVSLAWMGNVPALEIVESGVGAVFAQGVTKEGSIGYNSILVVPANSKLHSLAEVLQLSKGLRFGDGDPKSTSGHLVPYYFAFQKNGINNLQSTFRTVSSNSHQKNLLMVAKGELDVATANNEELNAFSHDSPGMAKSVRVVWESPLIPQSPLVWKLALPLELRRRILAFAVNYGSQDPGQRRTLEALNNLSGFRQSSNLQLVSVADIEMFKARQAINNDDKIGTDERARRIDEVIRRSSRLDMLLKITSASVR